MSCEGAIENWLANLLPVIKSSLQQQLVSALSQEIIQDGLTPRRLERERSIQSAGARKVTIDKDNRKGNFHHKKSGIVKSSNLASNCFYKITVNDMMDGQPRITFC